MTSLKVAQAGRNQAVPQPDQCIPSVSIDTSSMSSRHSIPIHRQNGILAEGGILDVGNRNHHRS